MEIKTLVAKAHENAVKHGFWEPPLSFGTAIALIHSELSEALEEERNGNPDVCLFCGRQKGKRRRKLRRKRHDVRRLRSDRRRYSVLKIDWGKAVKTHGQTQRKQSQNKGHGNPSEP